MTTTTTLQHVDLLADPTVQDLHFSYDFERDRRHAVVGARGSRLSIPGGLQVSFNTYFNSFFESYWYRHTTVGDITLSLDLAGHGAVSIYRQAGDGQQYLVKRIEYTSDDVQTVDIKIDRDSGFSYLPGRVWFEIDAYIDTRMEGGRWQTASAGRDVAAGIVFCTFNREEFLGNVLRSLQASPEVYHTIPRIYIVNQGDPLVIDDLIPGAPKNFLKRITLVEQENLGGCGGFTRGMFEVLRDPELSHFILLDDDIRLHAESLFRSIQFLSHAHENVAVGGHMLDLVSPTSLYEAGADLDPNVAEPVPLHHDLDLTDPENLENFLDPRSVEYNGWWLFGADKKMIEEIGLPMPSFIRGDDIEYGVRLRQSGYRTVAVPGIGVWHEPFYFKLGSWHLYFEVRNRLTMLSLHGNGDLEAVKRKLRRVFTRDSMLSRYHSCQFMISALEDYLSGPEQCFVTTNDALLARLEEMRELGPKKIDHVGGTGVRDFTGKFKILTKPLFVVLRLARLIFGSPVNPRLKTLGLEQLAPWRLAVFNGYRAVQPDGSALEYRRDPELERAQLVKFERLLAGLQYGFDDAVVDRSKEIPWLGRWEEIFKTTIDADTTEGAGVETGSPQ